MKKINVQVLHDLIMLKAEPLTLNKTSGGVIIPGDLDKQAPKRAVVVAAGPGTYNKKDVWIENPCKVGDTVLYAATDIKPVKVDGEDYLMINAGDVLLKFPKSTVTEAEIKQLVVDKLISMGLSPVTNIASEQAPQLRSFLVSVDSLKDPIALDKEIVAFTVISVTAKAGSIDEFIVRLSFHTSIK